ncbi:enoyl-CoA hydratase/isomerase family protein [Natrialbaceae archaeon GCM10025810]|uniref:enoyl-CoA hydratase/isomerase family protein n=1 Tax=Halovalidus salilacus TaxID=3075124 RepID=UPI003617F319
MGSETHLRVDVDDGVGRIVMDRPEAYNAMNGEMADGIADALSRLAEDDDVRAIALTGTEGTYNTGADLTTFEGDESDAERLESLADSLHAGIEAMIGAPKPVVAGVNGVVAGGGLGLALAADVVLVADDARFEYAYPRIGLSGDGGSTWLLPRLVGRRRAQSFAFLGEPIGPEDAVEIGLATEVVPADEFDDRLEAVATDLSSGPTRAYGEIKDLFRRSSTNCLDDHLDLEAERLAGLAETGDFARGIEAFREKEEPTFEGR